LPMLNVDCPPNLIKPDGSSRYSYQIR
jgi:hypothetical protein